LSAKIQFLAEMLVIEVNTPEMKRQRDPDLYDVPLVHFNPRATS
jgi:hypothetical protein